MSRKIKLGSGSRSPYPRIEIEKTPTHLARLEASCILTNTFPRLSCVPLPHFISKIHTEVSLHLISSSHHHHALQVHTSRSGLQIPPETTLPLLALDEEGDSVPTRETNRDMIGQRAARDQEIGGECHRPDWRDAISINPIQSTIFPSPVICYCRYFCRLATM